MISSTENLTTFCAMNWSKGSLQTPRQLKLKRILWESKYSGNPAVQGQVSIADVVRHPSQIVPTSTSIAKRCDVCYCHGKRWNPSRLAISGCFSATVAFKIRVQLRTKDLPEFRVWFCRKNLLYTMPFQFHQIHSFTFFGWILVLTVFNGISFRFLTTIFAPYCCKQSTVHHLRFFFKKMIRFCWF